MSTAASDSAIRKAQMHFCSDAQMPRSVKTAIAVLTDRVPSICTRDRRKWAAGTVPVWSLTCSSRCRHTRENSVGDGRGSVAFRKAGRSRICLSDNGKILKADCGFGLDDSKSSDALLLRCSDAEVGQDRAIGFDRPSTLPSISPFLV